jgi:hypothetical protein
MNLVTATDQQIIEHYALIVDDENLRQQFLQDLDEADAKKDAYLRRPEALAESAQWYAQNNIAVFPLQPRTKIPMPGSRGCKDATTNIDQIKTWWQQTPNANIGIATGNQFDVIDVDGPDGFESLSHINPRPNVLASVITPRGRHLYVKSKPERKNGTNLKLGMDFRAKGGYVVAPPSINPDNKMYAWLITPEELVKHCER